MHVEKNLIAKTFSHAGARLLCRARDDGVRRYDPEAGRALQARRVLGKSALCIPALDLRDLLRNAPTCRFVFV
jgi:hypothetical protein